MPQVYVAELVRLDDLGLLEEIGMFDRPVERRFLYVAAAPDAAFLLGNSLDPDALAHRHFVDEARSEYLDVAVRDKLDDLRLFRPAEEAEGLRDGRERFLAVPFFDRAGAPAGFLAVDTIGAPEAGAGAVGEPWAVDLLHAVAEFLARAAADSRGLADDCDELRGPVFFARRLVEIANGRLGGRDPPPDGPAAVFLERYAFLTELAARNRNILGDGSDLPPVAKRYFVRPEQLAHAQLGNLKDLRLALQEELTAPANEAELRLLRAAERPPRETLKVWRAVFILAGVADREVLNTHEDTAWARVQALLADSRPARERLPRLMAGLNPLVPRSIERADNLEQVVSESPSHGPQWIPRAGRRAHAPSTRPRGYNPPFAPAPPCWPALPTAAYTVSRHTRVLRVPAACAARRRPSNVEGPAEVIRRFAPDEKAPVLVQQRLRRRPPSRWGRRCKFMPAGTATRRPRSSTQVFQRNCGDAHRVCVCGGEGRALGQVYHLAQGLVLTIDTARLVTEGRLAVLLLEWVLVIFLIRQMEGALAAPAQTGGAGE